MSDYQRNTTGLFFQPMHPGVHLFRTWQFQLSVGVPIIVATVFFFWISYVEKLDFEMSSEAVRNLWVHHKLSLTLLGLIFPFTALVASHHRSVQASEQIRQQQSQNLLNNHFAHTDEFVKVWTELELPAQRQLSISMRRIHSNLYPGSLEGDFSVSKSFADFLSVFTNQCCDLLEAMANEHEFPDVGQELNSLSKAFSKQTGVSLSLKTIDATSMPFSTVSSAIRSVISNIYKLIEAASFLPPYNIRSLQSDLEYLEQQREEVCEDLARREQRLSAIGSSIEGLLESLGDGQVGNQANINHIQNLFAELVESGDYSEEEIRQWFPWERAQQRGMHLPDNLNGWIMRNAP